MEQLCLLGVLMQFFRSAYFKTIKRQLKPKISLVDINAKNLSLLNFNGNISKLNM